MCHNSQCKVNPILRENLVDQLNQVGYIKLHEWRSKEKTISIALSLGTVVEIETLLPESGISTVQPLMPGHKAESSSNTYTGTFGLAEFPFHTDLAHWAKPPRYIMLRCRKGTPKVTTRVLPCSELNSYWKISDLQRAIVRPRQTGPDNTISLLPLAFRAEGVTGLRWDSLFLVPMSNTAKDVADLLSSESWVKSKAKSLALTEEGDTLIIDNWRCLHGRSKVPEYEMNREIERVYLSTIYS